MATSGNKGLQFIKHERKQIDQIRADIHALASETGLEITECRRIVKAGGSARSEPVAGGSPPLGGTNATKPGART